MTVPLTEDYVDKLIRQAFVNAEDYFHTAIRVIDSRFGPGYAQNNPQMIGSFMQVATSDFGASVIAHTLQAGIANLTQAVAKLVSSPHHQPQGEQDPDALTLEPETAVSDPS